MTETEHIQARRAAHHKALETLAREVGCKLSGLVLWRKLNRIERNVYANCLAYTNGTLSLERWEGQKEGARQHLEDLFGAIPNGVYINGDPRGHCLKLDCDVRSIPDGMERDMGGNGILAATIENMAMRRAITESEAA